MREAIAQVENPKVKEVLEAPGASHGLEASLRSALIRELVDAANDPRGLARLLHKRSSSILERDLPQDQMEQFDEACAGRVSKLPVIWGFLNQIRCNSYSNDLRSKEMSRQVTISTPFPSLAETAHALGVSPRAAERVQRILSVRRSKKRARVNGRHGTTLKYARKRASKKT